jgi:hypothetical protein
MSNTGTQDSFYSESQLLWWVAEYKSHNITRFLNICILGELFEDRMSIKSVAVILYSENIEQISITELKHNQN